MEMTKATDNVVMDTAAAETETGRQAVH